jgi:hypothetical protein
MRLLRLTLGLPVYPVQRTWPSCRKAVLDVFGYHSLMCNAGGDRIFRHNAVRDTLFRMCQAAGLVPRKEQPLPDGHLTPGDIYIPLWSLGRPAAFHFSVTFPLQSSTIIGAAGSDGHAGTIRRQEKINKFEALYDKL